MKKILFVVIAISIGAGSASAGTIAGQIQTPSTGRGVPNGTLTFTLTQAAVISGTAAVAANGNCWTDSSGNVVGLPGDAAIAAPALSSNLGSGSLGSGTYFVRYTWANTTGESQPSAERSLALGSAGTLIVQAPVNVPVLATSMKVYIGTASGTELLQGSVAVTNGVLAGNYSQASALVAGAALPASNTSACQIRFNDELQPSYTGYTVTFTNVNGAGIAGFPQKWYLSGGSNGTVNLSQGTPLYSGVVQYPQAIVASPAANAQQSINGPLNLNGYTLSAGSLVLTPANMVCDGFTDDTAALNSAIASLGNSGGGMLWLPAKTCKIAGQITIPNNGANSNNKMIGGTIRISGQSGGGLEQGYVLSCSGTVLDMTFSATTGKIDSRGLGKLEIDHICFKDSATDGTTFIFATSTNVQIHDNQFLGNSLAAPLQDAIQLGGTGTTFASGSANDMCQGYGTDIHNNQFDYVKRAILLRNQCNSYNVTNNHVFNHAANASGGLIELDPGAGSTRIAAAVISGNLLEVGGSKYGINIVQNAVANIIVGNSCWDGGGPFTNCVFASGTGDSRTTIVNGYSNDDGSFFPNSLSSSDVQIGNGRIALAGTGSCNPAQLTIGFSGGLGTQGISIIGGSVVTCAGGGVIVSFGDASSPTNVQTGSGGSFGFSSSVNPNAAGTADTKITRAGAGEFGWTAVTFSNLGTPANGSFAYCSDCTIANPCAGGGTGALAKRLNGAWVCN